MFLPATIGSDETQEIKERESPLNQKKYGGSSVMCSNPSMENFPVS
jgi:hypothetical protein